jgi:hypothetical protein
MKTCLVRKYISEDSNKIGELMHLLIKIYYPVVVRDIATAEGLQLVKIVCFGNGISIEAPTKTYFGE